MSHTVFYTSSAPSRCIAAVTLNMTDNTRLNHDDGMHLLTIHITTTLLLSTTFPSIHLQQLCSPPSLTPGSSPRGRESLSVGPLSVEIALKMHARADVPLSLLATHKFSLLWFSFVWLVLGALFGLLTSICITCMELQRAALRA